jgi:hypothetical protein
MELLQQRLMNAGSDWVARGGGMIRVKKDGSYNKFPQSMVEEFQQVFTKVIGEKLKTLNGKNLMMNADAPVMMEVLKELNPDGDFKFAPDYPNMEMKPDGQYRTWMGK